MLSRCANRDLDSCVALQALGPLARKLFEGSLQIVDPHRITSTSMNSVDVEAISGRKAAIRASLIAQDQSLPGRRSACTGQAEESYRKAGGYLADSDE